MAMRRHVEHFGIAGIDNDVIDEQARAVQVNQHSPSLSAVSRSVDLAVKRAEIKPIRILGINYQGANVPPGWAGDSPFRTISAGGCRRGSRNAVRTNRDKPCESKPKG